MDGFVNLIADAHAFSFINPLTGGILNGNFLPNSLLFLKNYGWKGNKIFDYRGRDNVLSNFQKVYLEKLYGGYRRNVSLLYFHVLK